MTDAEANDFHDFYSILLFTLIFLHLSTSGRGYSAVWTAVLVSCACF